MEIDAYNILESGVCELAVFFGWKQSPFWGIGACLPSWRFETPSGAGNGARYSQKTNSSCSLTCSWNPLQQVTRGEQVGTGSRAEVRQLLHYKIFNWLCGACVDSGLAQSPSRGTGTEVGEA